MNLKSIITTAVAAMALVVLAAYLFIGPKAFFTGMVLGLFLALLGVAVFMFTMRSNAPAGSFAQLIKKQLIWSLLVRIPLMCLFFSIAVFFVRTSAVGLLAGVALGLFGYVIISFIKLLQARGEMAGS